MIPVSTSVETISRYKDFFGLSASPFELSPDPHFLFSSAANKDVLASISQAVRERKGFIVLTGEVGTGKTLMLRCLFRLWERQQTPFAYFIGPKLSTVDFLSYLTFELGLEVQNPTKGRLLRSLYEFFLAQFDKGLTTVLIIDEAHQMPRSVLEEVRLLANFETAKRKLIQILLVGQPELDKKLDTMELRSLKQRIAVRCKLAALGGEEIRHYIKHRLEVAGADSSASLIFPPDTIKAIHRHSSGVPRLVNSICDQAMVTAYERQVRAIPVEIVDEAASYFHLPSARNPKQTEEIVLDVSSRPASSVNAPTAETLGSMPTPIPPISDEVKIDRWGLPPVSDEKDRQTESPGPVVPIPPDFRSDPPPDSLNVNIVREPEVVPSGSERNLAARMCLAGLAALVLFASVFWFRGSRPLGPKTFSDRSSPSASSGPPNVEATGPNPADAPVVADQSSGAGGSLRAASLPSSNSEEEKFASKSPAIPEERRDAATSSSPRPGIQESPRTGGGTAVGPRDLHPSGALNDDARSGVLPQPAPVVETTRLESVELPVDPAWAANPLMPPIAPASSKYVNASQPDFVLDHFLKGHSGWVTGVAFSSDGRRLASGSWDQTVKVWDVSTGQELSDVHGKLKEVQAVAYSRDGHWLAAENSSDAVILWDATTGRETYTLASNKPLGLPGSNWVYSIAFSPDGRWLASGVDDKTIRLWDVTTGRIVRDLTGPRRSVMYVAFSPDGRWLASGDDDKSIRIWDAATGQELGRLSGHTKAIYTVVFSPDGRWLASASADKTIRLWDVATGREVHILTGHGNIVTSLAFSPDGRWLASGSWDKTIKIWDVETGREVQTLRGHNRSIYTVAFDSSGLWLASGSEDGTIGLWRLSGAVEQSAPR